MATTNINITRSFHKAINQIAQKYSLTPDAKKVVSDFIKQNMSGEVVLKKLPTDKPTPKATLHLKCSDFMLLIHHFADDASFYLEQAELPVTVEEKTVSEEFVELPANFRDMIVTKTLQRAEVFLENKLNLELSDIEKTQIYNFLIAQEITGKVAYYVTHLLPEGDYQRATVVLDNCVKQLNLVFGKNPYDNAYAHVMWVNVTKTAYAKAADAAKHTRDVFERFWVNRGLPKTLFETVYSQVDISKPIKISAFPKAGDWDRYRKTVKATNFIGQKPDEKGKFVPNKPIGFVDGNNIAITVPGTNGTIKYYEYNA